MLTDDERELRSWTETGKAPAGSCPFCASRISMIQRDGFFRARCSHRGCGASGPKMRSITRAADLFCCPPQRTAGGTIAARLSTGTVGELLATAPVGITMWTATSGEAMRYMVIDGRGYCQYWSTGRRRWSDAVLSHLDIGRPARWISLGDFDPRDPSTRGPIGEG